MSRCPRRRWREYKYDAEQAHEPLHLVVSPHRDSVPTSQAEAPAQVSFDGLPMCPTEEIISIFETSLRITSSAPHHPPLRPHPPVISTQRRCATSTPIRATPRRPRWTAGRRRAHALRDHCASPSSAPRHPHFRPHPPAISITLAKDRLLITGSLLYLITDYVFT